MLIKKCIQSKKNTTFALRKSMLMRNCFFALILMLYCINAAGQDAYFSQSDASRLCLNPSYSGDSGRGRIAMGYKNQWQGVGGFNSIHFSYDQNIEKIKSGIGLQAVSYMPSELQSKNYLKAFYSYDLQVSRDLFFRVGIAGGVRIEQFNAGKLVLPENFYNIYTEVLTDSIVVKADFAIGMSVNYKDKFHVGMSIDHVTLDTDNPLKFTLDASANVNIDSDDFVLIPYLIYRNQSGYDLLSIGAGLKMKPLILALGYEANILGYSFKNMHSLILQAGMEFNDLQVRYSYNVVLSGLGMRTHGAHEISLVYCFGDKIIKRY